MNKYLVIGLVLASSAIANSALAQKPPQPLTLNICSSPEQALRSFKDKFLQKLLEGRHRPYAFSPNDCKQATIMSNDVASTPSFKSLGDTPKFKQEHPAVFEVYFTDADCERQCMNKAGGWISSYELPIRFWPEGDQWVKAMKNRVVMGYALEQMKAADKVFSEINSYPEKERVARYEEARKNYNEWLDFMRRYGL